MTNSFDTQVKRLYRSRQLVDSISVEGSYDLKGNRLDYLAVSVNDNFELYEIDLRVEKQTTNNWFIGLFVSELEVYVTTIQQTIGTPIDDPNDIRIKHFVQVLPKELFGRENIEIINSISESLYSSCDANIFTFPERVVYAGINNDNTTFIGTLSVNDPKFDGCVGTIPTSAELSAQFGIPRPGNTYSRPATSDDEWWDTGDVQTTARGTVFVCAPTYIDTFQTHAGQSVKAAFVFQSERLWKGARLVVRQKLV